MIIDYDSILEYFPEDCGYRIVLTSMPADPIHPGHISMLKNMPETFYKWLKHHNSMDVCSRTMFVFICLVNNDQFLINKKGFRFMPLEDRLQIVDAIGNNSIYAVAYNPSNPNDMTVSEAIRHLKPIAFMKGGDRIADETLPEWNACKEVRCTIIDRVGAEKKWSSSNYLKEYKDYVLNDFQRNIKM